MITLRRSNERGRGGRGWLRSFHGFSFSGYRDPRHTVVARGASTALVAALLAAALLGNAGVEAEPGSVAAPRATVMPEEYRSVRCAGFDYDPAPIPPSETWPAQ